jgi:hypothetical protein
LWAFAVLVVLNFFIYIISCHSAAEHRASTRILHHTQFLALLVISPHIFLTPLASSSAILLHLFLGLTLPHLPWGFHCRACLAMLCAYKITKMSKVLYKGAVGYVFFPLTLYPLTTTIVAPPCNAIKWQMGFNLSFKGLIFLNLLQSVLGHSAVMLAVSSNNM